LHQKYGFSHTSNLLLEYFIFFTHYALVVQQIDVCAGILLDGNRGGVLAHYALPWWFNFKPSVEISAPWSLAKIQRRSRNAVQAFLARPHMPVAG
jgi:hypothetical protein